MNAKPVKDPDGVVRGWCCGVCFHVARGIGEPQGAADERTVKASQEAAERCCLCPRCGGIAPKQDARYLLHDCNQCAEELAEERRAKLEQRLGGPFVKCPACKGWPDHNGPDTDAHGERCCVRCDDLGVVLAASVGAPP